MSHLADLFGLSHFFLAITTQNDVNIGTENLVNPGTDVCLNGCQQSLLQSITMSIHACEWSSENERQNSAFDYILQLNQF